MSQGPPRRPCKFGENCNQWKSGGTCTFLHDNNNLGGYQQGGGGGRGGNSFGGRGSSFNPNLPNNYNQGGSLGGGGRGGRGGTGNYQGQNPNYQGQNPNYQGQNPNYQGQNPNYQVQVGNTQGGRGGGNQGGNQPNSQDNITQAFCKFFQQGECKNENCKRPHEFVKGDLLRRVMRTIDVPKNQVSNLRMLTVNNAKYFTLRVGETITIFQYESESGKINQMGEQMVLQYKNMHYFDAKQQYIYFAYENPNTSFSNIGFMDVRTRVRVTVDNAHKLKITGMVHTLDTNNQPIVLSSSIEGTIKVWRIVGEKLELSQDYTDGLAKLFKTNTTTFQVNFLDKQILDGNQVISAGTSDNRLLFWIGPQLSYQQLIFPENYNKVLAIKYMKFGANWVALAIVWNAANSMSALIAVNLSNMGYEVVATQQSNSIRYLYHSIQTIGSLLLLANVSGLVSIYKVPDFKAKVGCIMHSNSIADMVSYKSYTSTGIEMLNLFVLQRMENGRAGSFSIYSLRQ